MHIARRSTHASRLERWLGADALDSLLEAARGVYHPIPVMNVPGEVYAYQGDFVGPIKGGDEASTKDYLLDRIRHPRAHDAQLSPATRAALGARAAGFASLSDLISEATTGGKRQDILHIKVGVTGVATVTNTLWFEGVIPAAGSSGAALAAGTDCTRATTGAMGPQTNAAGGDTLHLTTWTSIPTASNMTLMLYDRLWHGVPLINTTSAQTITHTLPRYVTAALSKGNVIFIEVTTALPATAHTWTFVYVDDAGNTAQTTGAVAGLASAIAKRVDHATSFIPLAANDAGFQDLTSVTLSATLASGALNIVCGHPLAFMPQVTAGAAVMLDGINSAFNLVRIYDDACLALLEVSKGGSGATTYQGQLILVSG